MRFAWILLFLAACETPRLDAQPAASQSDAGLPRFARKSPRLVGCRELTMRLSQSLCDFGDLWVPAADARPDHLAVEAAEGITVDACLRRWEQLAIRCGGVRP